MQISANNIVLVRQLQLVWYVNSLTGATALTGSSVVDGTGPIVLDNLGCRNTESRLVDCRHDGLGVHDCLHSEDTGVRCLPSITSKPEYIP